jgi:small-conductance mechanosensitive channel
MSTYFHQAWETLNRMGHAFFARLPLILVAVVVFFVFLYAARGVRSLVRRLASEKRRHRNLGLVLGRVMQGAMILLGTLIAMTIVFPSFQAADLIGVLGLGSVAIGFAFRDILANFLAGILLLLTEPFKLNDQIIVGTFEGTVTSIQTRATIIRTYDGRRVVIPNEKLFTESVTVNTARENRRSHYDVGIGVGDDIDRARQLMVEAVRKVEGVLPVPAPEALVVDLADFAVKLRVMWWTAPPEQINMLRTTDQCLTAIKNTLIANGIDLPYPTQQVLFHDQTEETDADRARQREGWPAGKDGEVPKPRRVADAIRLLARRSREMDGRTTPPLSSPPRSEAH